MIKFYDTSSLLLLDQAELSQEKFLISSITLEELENIKTAYNKDSSIKYAARNLLRILETIQEKYEIVLFKDKYLNKIKFPVNNDIKILSCAVAQLKQYKDLIFVTNDLALSAIAKLYLPKSQITSIQREIQEDTYTGYKDIIMSEDDMANFYQYPQINKYDLLTNEYIIVRNIDGEIVDKLCWDGKTHRALSYPIFSSYWFGDIKPYKDDPYQAFAADSLTHNQITMIAGRAGSGKTFLSLAYLFSLLGKGKIDRIVIFCNPVVAKDAAKLGFYPGTVLEKLLSTQAGAVLSSKLGDSIVVEDLVQKGQLVLIPAGDARGYEVPPNSGVYIMESQNLTSDLMRMLLQRISETCKVIIDGDYAEQVDMDVYAGSNNGMRRCSEAFRGEDLFAQVELKTIHRSKIADIAERMK